jgi:hypothetical protein
MNDTNHYCCDYYNIATCLVLMKMVSHQFMITLLLVAAIPKSVELELLELLMFIYPHNFVHQLLTLPPSYYQ